MVQYEASDLFIESCVLLIKGSAIVENRQTDQVEAVWSAGRGRAVPRPLQALSEEHKCLLYFVVALHRTYLTQ